jgi:ion channel POLLUX/CASTOR
MQRLNRRIARIRVIQRLQFWLERQFIRGASFQLMTVAALIGLISLAGGALLLPAAEESEGLGETVWWAFLRLTDPGYLGDDEACGGAFCPSGLRFPAMWSFLALWWPS